MPGINLTRQEAIDRAAALSVESYDIALDVTTGATVFRGVTTVTFSALPGTDTFIDAITETVHSVTLNGVELDPAAVADGTRIALAGLAADNVLVVDADFAYSATGEGLHRFVDPVDSEVYLYSQFEVPDSRRVFAVFEQPDLKATFTFTVTAPAHWQVFSNQPTPDAVPTERDGVSTWSFGATPRISSYITAIVAGPYHVERDELTSSDGRTIPLAVACRTSLAPHLDTDEILDVTRAGFAYYEEKFGVPYPFDKYDQLFVPEFNAGAMENAGCVTFTETYVFRSKVTDAIRERRVVTILHELAHMWFGDLVTMRWWNDLWLNESFAEWASTISTAEATRWTEAWTTFQAMEKTWAYRQDQLPSTHPIAADIPDLEAVQVNFDGITYAKGGSVLKQLAAWVGVDAFFSGVGAYFRENAWKNTELGDLLRHLEAASGRDLSGWSAQWLETAGVNTLRTEISTDDAGVITGFAVRQEAPADYPTLRQHRLGIGLYDLVADSDGIEQAVLRRRHYVEVDIDGSLTAVPELIGLDRGDLVLINDEDLAYAKIRLDTASLDAAVRSLGAIESPLARALVWGAAWDATRDGEWTASAYIRLVLGNIAAETESTTIRTTLGQLLLAARAYVSPERQEETVATVGTALWELARGAAPGSDAQFQFVKFFAAAASTTGHGAALSDLLTGVVTLDGLEIDTDLRWELLEGLVVLGVAGEAEIAAELASDATAKGEQSAQRLRAAIPTLEAKQAAFDALADGALSNDSQRSVGLGYSRVDDPRLLESFVSPYFERLTGVWETTTHQTAESFVLGAYPAALASQGLVAAADAWLDATTATPGLRRLVRENQAATRRALAAQERDRIG